MTNSGVMMMRTVNTALVTFMVGNDGRYAASVDELVTGELLDEAFLNGEAGYRFLLSVSEDGSNYGLSGIPVSNREERVHFYSSADGVVHYQIGEAASWDSPPIGDKVKLPRILQYWDCKSGCGTTFRIVGAKPSGGSSGVQTLIPIRCPKCETVQSDTQSPEGTVQYLNGHAWIDLPGHF